MEYDADGLLSIDDDGNDPLAEQTVRDSCDFWQVIQTLPSDSVRLLRFHFAHQLDNPLPMYEPQFAADVVRMIDGLDEPHGLMPTLLVFWNLESRHLNQLHGMSTGLRIVDPALGPVSDLFVAIIDRILFERREIAAGRRPEST